MPTGEPSIEWAPSQQHHRCQGASRTPTESVYSGIQSSVYDASSNWGSVTSPSGHSWQQIATSDSGLYAPSQLDAVDNDPAPLRPRPSKTYGQRHLQVPDRPHASRSKSAQTMTARAKRELKNTFQCHFCKDKLKDKDVLRYACPLMTSVYDANFLKSPHEHTQARRRKEQASHTQVSRVRLRSCLQGPQRPEEAYELPWRSPICLPSRGLQRPDIHAK